MKYSLITHWTSHWRWLAVRDSWARPGELFDASGDAQTAGV